MPAQHKPTDATRAQVKSLASFGIPREDIAQYMEMTEKTLKKHYDDEIRIGRAKTNAAVGQFLGRMATGQAMKDKDNPATRKECLTAAIFWSKVRMGFSESPRKSSPLSDMIGAGYDE